MSGKRGTRRWIRGHLADPYVRRAAAEGYRSRAAFKLVEIDDRERLLRPGRTVVDLGAAPGGWSQVAAARVSPGGRVVAVDLLAMEPIAGVDFVQGDFTDPQVRAAIAARLERRAVDLVISDMAPNLTGVKDADEARAEALAREVLEFAAEWLRPEGAVLVKIFHGRTMQELVDVARGAFRRVKLLKPKASRSRSAETYLLGRGAGVV